MNEDGSDKRHVQDMMHSDRLDPHGKYLLNVSKGKIFATDLRYSHSEFTVCVQDAADV